MRHTSSLAGKLTEAQEAVQQIIEPFLELQRVFAALLETRLEDQALDDYLCPVFPDPAGDAKKEAREIADRHRKAAKYLSRHGRGNGVPGVKGSLWAAYNGVTDYVDHRKPNRRASDFSDSRLNYVWFGAGERVKQRALSAALQLAPQVPPLSYLDVPPLTPA
jgi:hypothetical protein